MTVKQENIEIKIPAQRVSISMLWRKKTPYRALIVDFIKRRVPICTWCQILHERCQFLHDKCQNLRLKNLIKKLIIFSASYNDTLMECRYCNRQCIKKGFYKEVQRYYCNLCNKYQQATYSYNRCNAEHEKLIIRLNNEGNGISSIARLTKLSKTTVIRKIKKIADAIKIPALKEDGQRYEMDELQTYVGRNKQSHYRYVIYAINKTTRRVVYLAVGRRTSENLKKVVDVILRCNPKRIYTDGLIQYQRLIPKSIHKVFVRNINHIERCNLNLRTHIKRLFRKTICYSKSIEMLEACLKIYFWKNTILTS